MRSVAHPQLCRVRAACTDLMLRLIQDLLFSIFNFHGNLFFRGSTVRGCRLAIFNWKLHHVAVLTYIPNPSTMSRHSSAETKHYVIGPRKHLPIRLSATNIDS